MLRDSHSRMSLALALVPAVLNATTNGAWIDLQGFGSATVLLATGAGGIAFDGTNKIEFVLEHSDDAAAGTPVTDAEVIGVSGISAGIVRSLTAAKPAADVQKVGYRGGKRYIRLNAKFSGAHGTGTAISATVIRSRPDLAPTA